MRYFIAVLSLIATLLFVSCKKSKSTTVVTPSAASISTSPATEITDASAKAGGAILSEGSSAVFESGICIDTVPAPSIATGTVIKNAEGSNYVCTILNLKSFKTYFVRAYAINDVGVAYGGDVSFKTKDSWRSVSIGRELFKPNCMKYINGTVFLGTEAGLYSSSNEGQTWNLLAFENKGVLAIDATANVMYVVAGDQGLYKSTNNGVSWVKAYDKLGYSYNYDITCKDNFVFVSTNYNLFASTDNGANFVSYFPPASTTFNSFTKVAWYSKHFYTVDARMQLFWFNTDDASWVWVYTLPNGFQTYSPSGLYTLNDELLVSTSAGLVKADKGGQTAYNYTNLESEPTLIEQNAQQAFAVGYKTLNLSYSDNAGKNWRDLGRKGLSSLSGITGCLVSDNCLFIYYSNAYAQLYRMRMQ